ncbi:MAG: diadenylate cyclase CdaA [Candidatus Electryonea clarkiae]|nr:diadenylate cyclase CdaA [Candidatus Electryonea clarkiae]MDP8285685.1 diadenylate cyclase CdaA [Candidatus Electryonea clarkiae]
MEIFRIGFMSFTLIDLVDIFLVTFVFYKLYDIMRGTRASQMFIGLIIILLISVVVRTVGLKGMTWLLDSIAKVWVIAFVILFQPELRRLLIQLGKGRLVQRIFKVPATKIIDEICNAAIDLSQKRYGGLIVLQRDMGMRAIIETGIKMQAEATGELIVSIFFPRTPLHDGAVIINGNVIEAARCILPLTQNPNIDPSLGTRHRAALGATEESDCAVVVVSEETGQISLAYRGAFIERGMTGEQLSERLQQIFEKVHGFGKENTKGFPAATVTR